MITETIMDSGQWTVDSQQQALWFHRSHQKIETRTTKTTTTTKKQKQRKTTTTTTTKNDLLYVSIERVHRAAKFSWIQESTYFCL
jgi:hypothetical protein